MMDSWLNVFNAEYISASVLFTIYVLAQLNIIYKNIRSIVSFIVKI